MWRFPMPGLLLAALLHLGGGPASAATLQDIVATVAAEHPAVQAARARLRQAEAGRTIARAGARPQLQATTTNGAAWIQGGETDGTGVTTRSALELRQPVYAGGELAARRREAGAAEREAAARLGLALNATLLRAVQAYGAVEAGRALLELAELTETELTRVGTLTGQRFRFGDATTTDIALAEARAAAATANRLEALARLRQAEAEFVSSTGMAPGDLSPLPSPAGLPASLDEARAAAADHPALAAGSADIAGAKAGVDLAKAAFQPRLGLVGRLAFTDQPENDLGRRSEASIAATVAVPLYQGGADKARLRQSREVLAERRFAREDGARAVERDLAVAWAAREAALRRLPPLRAQARAAGIAAAGAAQEAAIGGRTVLEVLDAERDLFQAQAAARQAEVEAVLADWSLLGAMGRLGPDQAVAPPPR